MKVMKKVGLAMAIVGMLTVSAYAGPYVGFQIGPNFNAASDAKVAGFSVPNPKFNAGVAVGGQVGFDFNDPRYKFPAWAKYFGVAADYQFNTLSLSNSLVNNRNGNQNALSLLGVVKYPMMVTKDYPNGRLFPYVAAGPSLVFTSLAGQNATNIGVTVEPGVRYMFTPRIAGELGYRFRYAGSDFPKNVRYNNFNHTVMARVAYHF